MPHTQNLKDEDIYLTYGFKGFSPWLASSKSETSWRHSMANQMVAKKSTETAPEEESARDKTRYPNSGLHDHSDTPRSPLYYP